MSVNEVNKLTGDTSKIAGGTLYADAPIGAILAFGGATAPAGWMICNGAAISRTTYAALFAAIGTAFGAGDGSTTFNIPDLRGEFLRGAGTNSHAGEGDGGSVGAHQAATIHSRLSNSDTTEPIYIYQKNQNLTYVDKAITGAAYYSYTNKTGNGTTQDNEAIAYKARPTNTSVNYIIKAEQVALPADFETKVSKKLDKFYLDQSGLDLDNCTEAGLYEINTLVANMPSGADGGNMIVSHNPSSGAVVQTYFATNTQIASRYKLSGASWTAWLSPFTDRPALQYAKNVQYTSDASGNIVFANSIDNVVIVSVRVRGNATWTMGYNPLAGYYIHLMDYTGQVLPSTTVNLDVVYYSYDWTA